MPNQTLLNKGWINYYSCHTCKGLVEHYNHPDHPGFEILIRINRNSFRIYEKNYNIAGPFWCYDIENKLNEFIPKIDKQ